MNKLRLSAFRIDGDKHSALGFTDGTHWNGWAKPKFLRHHIEGYLKANGWSYEFKGKDLIIHFEGSDDETYSPAPFYTARLGKTTLYDLTGLIWDDVQEVEKK